MYLSKDVAGALSPPHSGSDHSHSAFWLFSALFCTSLPVFGLLHCYLSLFFFCCYLCWLHSVSVQRRDRCIVTYSPHSDTLIDPLRFWLPFSFSFSPSFPPSPSPFQFNLLGFPLSTSRVYLSKDVAGTPLSFSLPLCQS